MWPFWADVYFTLGHINTGVLMADDSHKRSYSLFTTPGFNRYLGEIIDVDRVTVDGAEIDFWQIAKIDGHDYKTIRLVAGTELHCYPKHLRGTITISVNGLREHVKIPLSLISDLTWVPK